jgi:hypothetical protein
VKTPGAELVKRLVQEPRFTGKLAKLFDLIRFRVDNIHMETYRMLGGLHRNGVQGETEIELIMA